MDESASTLCALPWSHLHVWADGRIFPCCYADFSSRLGTHPSDSLRDAWNAPLLKQIRLDMLAGKRPSACKSCWAHEDAGLDSGRQRANAKFPDRLLAAKASAPDGAADFHLAYVDIRFSNICNFKCRTCGPEFSNRWQQALNQGVRHELNDKVVDEIVEALPDVQEIYFAGGEPLLMRQHLSLLQKLAESPAPPRLSYTTNLSRLSFAGVDLLSLWQRIPEVLLTVSVDGSGARGEAIRDGFSWEAFRANLTTVQARLPHVRIFPTVTLSLFNLFHFADLHQTLVEECGFQPEDVLINPVFHPEHMSVYALPPERKRRWAERMPEAGPHLRDKLAQIERLMFQVDRSDLWEQFLRELRTVEDWATLFPEYVS